MSRKAELRKEIIEKVGEFYRASEAEKTIFIPGQQLVHFAGRVYDGDEISALVDSSLDFWLTEEHTSESV